MFAFLDGDFLMNVSRFIREGGKPSELSGQGWRPDLAKRSPTKLFQMHRSEDQFSVSATEFSYEPFQYR
jgi:hypothetical protein